jgi:histidine ammonia-lyase
MGSIAARKAVEILRNVEHIIAIELLCAAQGINFRGSDNLGKGTKVAYSLLRKYVPMLKEDRILSNDIEAVAELIRSEQLTNTVKEIVN